MSYQNKLLLSEGKRIRSVLQHHEWLEKEHDEPLDLTHLSQNPPLSTASWLSQLEDSERQKLYDRLADLEVIFWTLGEKVVDKMMTDKNSQALNESYEAAIENRRIAKYNRPDFEKVAA